MRCFLAIDLPKEVKKELFNLQKQLPKASMKLVEQENLHLTLKFFGEIEDFQVNKIKKVLEELKFERFDVKLDNIGVFPTKNFIKIVWIAIEPAEKVKEFHKQIDSILLKNGFKHDKNFKPHITLARVKFVKDRELFYNRLIGLKIKAVEFKVKKFSLKKSELTREGPKYETLKEYILR